MSQSNLTAPSTSDVIIGRLQKKVAKLQKQRDHYKQQVVHYKEVMDAHPMTEYRYKKYKEMIAEQEYVKALETRVKEQAQLIQLLTQQS